MRSVSCTASPTMGPILLRISGVQAAGMFRRELIATIRPIVGIFFATRRLSPHEFFGIAFWIGFTLHLILAEVWINYTRGVRQVVPTTVVKLEPVASS